MSDWSNIPITEVGELEFTLYFTYLRDAYIYLHNQTEEGRKWLDKAWILEQTEPDRKRLDERFGKGAD